MSDDQHEPTTESERHSRRDVLGLAGIGAAGLVAGASLSRAEEAAAADGDPLLIGLANTGTNKTQLTTSGAIADDAAFKVIASSADYGLIASANTIGAFGSGAVGVLGDGAVGGQFSGTDAAINLEPRGLQGPPGGTNFKGDIVLDSLGVLYLCVAAGTPGTWIKISHGGVRLLPAPQRAYDSRVPGPQQGKLIKAQPRELNVVGAVPAIPAGALAIVANLTVAETLNKGFLTAYPAGTAWPGTSNLNWPATDSTVANSATVSFGDGASAGKINLYAGGGLLPDGAQATHVIVDVVGYVL